MIRDGENDADEARGRTREKREGRQRPRKGGCLIHSNTAQKSMVCLSVYRARDPSHTHPFWEFDSDPSLACLAQRAAAPPSGMATLSRLSLSTTPGSSAAQGSWNCRAPFISQWSDTACTRLDAPLGGTYTVLACSRSYISALLHQQREGPRLPILACLSATQEMSHPAQRERAQRDHPSHDTHLLTSPTSMEVYTQSRTARALKFVCSPAA